MKMICSIFLLFGCLAASAQEPAFDGKKWEAPYYLAKPDGWDIERFPLPAAFAPGIQYKGMEDIRFTPGWAKSGSDEYWSYAFLWFLDGKQSFNANTIETKLTAYYTGLFNSNTDRKKLDTTQLVAVKVAVSPAKIGNGDLQRFTGTVLMNDYMTKKPIKLNLVVHISSCENKNKTFAFFELSPKGYGDKVWFGLDRLWQTFKCNKE